MICASGTKYDDINSEVRVFTTATAAVVAVV